MNLGTARVRASAPLVVAALALGLLAGCTSARDTLGTSSSQCFRAVPVAEAAVEHRGTFVGVRLIGAAQLRHRQQMRQLLAARAGPKVRSLCIVTFHGHFDIDQVKKAFGMPPPEGEGIYAVAVVSSPQNELIGTLVLTRQPLSVRHEVLGRPTVRPASPAPLGARPARHAPEPARPPPT